MLRIGSAIALTGAVLASPLAAQQLPATKLNVVGNLGITTQYKDRELPFWTKTIPEASGGKVTAQIKSWSEMGMKGPEVFLRAAHADPLARSVVLPGTGALLPRRDP